MSSLTWTIYLFDILDKIGSTSCFFIFAFGVVYLAWWIIKFIAIADKDIDKDLPAPAKWVIFGFVVSLIIYSFIPSKQTMILMASAEVGSRIISTEKFNATLDPALDLLNTWIVQEKKELIGVTDKK